MVSVMVGAVMVAAAVVVGEKATTLTGWLSDKGCAGPKIKAEEVTANNTTCVKKCLDDGAEAVFVHPETRSLYALKDYPSLRADVGYHLELTGVVDEQTKTISVRGVKRLSEIVNVCALPKKK